MHILIADDESIIRMGLKAMLQEMGHRVTAATNGREALEMARHHRPDMAIFDINMPYTDGIQAAKTLSRTMPMPILILTAYSDQDLVEKAADLPIQGYLLKPIDPKQLEAAITVAVKQFGQLQHLQTEKQDLAEKLEARKIIDRAKGKLMVQQGIGEQQAYQMLQFRAREKRMTVEEVAKKIVGKRE